MAKHPAAFINAISEEGTKAEAIKYLQKTWDELIDAKEEIKRLTTKLNNIYKNDPDVCE